MSQVTFKNGDMVYNIRNKKLWRVFKTVKDRCLLERKDGAVHSMVSANIKFLIPESQYIAEQIHLSQNFINRYLFACHIAKIIQEIPAMATVYHSQKTAQESSNPLQSFFRSLRKKLGI